MKMLRNDEFRYFLTKSGSSDKYQTRIDLLLELLTGESAHNEQNRYAPFAMLHKLLSELVSGKAVKETEPASDKQKEGEKKKTYGDTD